MDVLDEMVGVPQDMSEIRQLTKNTFLHFQKTDSQRRQTCSGGMLALRRTTWDEEDISAKMQPKKPALVLRRARPGDTIRADLRATTYASGAVKLGRKPQSCPARPTGNQAEYHALSPTNSQAQYVKPGFQLNRFAECQARESVLSCSSTRYPSSSESFSVCSSRFSSVSSVSSSPPSTWAARGAPAAWGLSSTQGTEAAVPAAPREERQPKKSKKPVIPPRENEVTFMVRNLPPHYTPASLLQEVHLFLPNIDFFYLPTNFETKKNLGYAFFNFDDKQAAEQFEQFWLESGISRADDQKPALQRSRLQGKEANVESFRNSSVLRVLPEYLKPQVFYRGVLQAFPKADKALPKVCPRFRAPEPSA